MYTIHQQSNFIAVTYEYWYDRDNYKWQIHWPPLTVTV